MPQKIYTFRLEIHNQQNLNTNKLIVYIKRGNSNVFDQQINKFFCIQKVVPCKSNLQRHAWLHYMRYFYKFVI